MSTIRVQGNIGEGGSGVGGTSILITIYSRRVVFFHSFCIFPGGNVKGGKQPEDLFSHFDFDFRLQSSCWREGAVSGLPYVVLLLSHCFARTYVGIWYICICRYICIHIYVSVASSAQSVCFAHSNLHRVADVHVFCKALYLFGGNIRKNHRPLIDRSSTAHRPLIDRCEKPHRPHFLIEISEVCFHQSFNIQE